MNSSKMAIYVDVEGEPQGPFSAEELSALWKAGEIDQNARFWYRGLSMWQSVSQFTVPTTEPQTPANLVELTTAPSFTGRCVEHEIDIVASECALGTNLLKDILVSWVDTVGGRSQTMQNHMRLARETCLNDLRRAAHCLKADGVISVSLTYSELSGQGKGMLFLAAYGTAVLLGPPPVR